MGGIVPPARQTCSGAGLDRLDDGLMLRDGCAEDQAQRQHLAPPAQPGARTHSARLSLLPLACAPPEAETPGDTGGAAAGAVYVQIAR